MKNNRNIREKSNFFDSKIEILDNNRKFWVKSKFLGKIEIFCQNTIFRKNSTYWSNIEILLKIYGCKFKPKVRSPKHCFGTLSNKLTRFQEITPIFPKKHFPEKKTFRLAVDRTPDI